MNRRKGISLIEVLAAIFVMGIGMIALLTLFPLGALTMAQAIKDGRTAQAAANAAAVAELFHGSIRQDTVYVRPALDPSRGNAYEGPSNPVYLDPIGFMSIGTTVCGIIPRRTIPTVASPPTGSNPNQAAMKWFTLLDDMNFYDNGQPARPFGAIQRQGTFSWAFMVKRPRWKDDAVVNLTVVLYKGRGLQLSAGLLAQTEELYTATGAQGSSSITLTAKPGAAVQPKRGGWILDATRETSNAGLQQHGPIHAYFYRILGVTPSLGSLVLDVAGPLKANVSTAIILENVVEVFEKGPGWIP
jgi:hypothetical protein